MHNLLSCNIAANVPAIMTAAQDVLHPERSLIVTTVIVAAG
jgi:hypothetical protein